MGVYHFYTYSHTNTYTDTLEECIDNVLAVGGVGLTRVFPNACFAKFGTQVSFRISRASSSCLFGTLALKIIEKIVKIRHSNLQAQALQMVRLKSMRLRGDIVCTVEMHAISVST